MTLSESDKKELEILQWPYINPNGLNDSDAQRLDVTFEKMRQAGSKATVIDIIEFMEVLHPDDKRLHDWTRKRITDFAARYFPAE
jgi:hypothetical protein